MNIQDITTKLNITLSPMQEAASKAFIQSHDNLIILSPTGSGKTLAYLLPLTQFVQQGDASVQAIILVPGRELAVQSYEVFRNLGSGLRGYVCHGGRPTMEEHQEIRAIHPQVIFATPGRMLDHLDKHNFEDSAIRLLVIDEFDKCLQLGFQQEMSSIVEHLSPSIRKVFLSATKPDTEVPSLFDTSNFKTIDFREEDTGERIKVFCVRSEDKDKLTTLNKLLLSLQTHCSIVFLNYRESVERTAHFLSTQGFSVSAYHGGLDQRQREEALYQFANHSTNILVCTDLGSRGLDIPDVENIIHYHLPEPQDAYIRRIGRTARWDKQGKVFFLLNSEEQLPAYISEADDYTIDATPCAPLQPLMTTLYIGKGKKDKLSKGDIVGFLCKTGQLKASDIGRIDVYDHYSLVAVNAKLAEKTVSNVKGKKIKGIKTIIERHTSDKP